MKSFASMRLGGVRPRASKSFSLPFYNAISQRLYSEVGTPDVIDGRARLSGTWVPTGGIAESADEDSHAKLIRAGFLRQAHSGIFHMLPLGRRVQDKLEALIDKHMSSLGASKLALSSISSTELWTKSGRLNGAGSELFRFHDRKDVNYILSPTHEEEITNLVLSTVTSYKELPVRLYQISRKYRDELRPRQGLLRSREFIMKDLYTFDHSPPLALKTYQSVRGAYARLFDELKIPYLVADADSGQIGGDLSHEYHFPTAKGEDNVISCTKCDYVANEELAENPITVKRDIDDVCVAESNDKNSQVWRGISRDRKTLINVWYPTSSSTGLSPPEVNIHAIQSIIPELDTSIEDALPLWKGHQTQDNSSLASQPVPSKMINLLDARLNDPEKWPSSVHSSELPFWPTSLGTMPSLIQEFQSYDADGQPLNLLRIQDGDNCNHCTTGKLKVQKAIELGHTFHLGTRYSEPMEALVTVPNNLLETAGTAPDPPADLQGTSRVPMQMGCHGIGVSRIIGAVADTLADDKGLNWPRVMAPYEVVVIPTKNLEEAAVDVYDELVTKSDSQALDVILDDRLQSFGWKLRDADLVGYPIIVVLGKTWKPDRMCEIQCRRLEVRQNVALHEMKDFIGGLLQQL